MGLIKEGILRHLRLIYFSVVGLGVLTGLLMSMSLAFQSGAFYGSTHWAVCPPEGRYSIACDGSGRCFRLDRKTGEVEQVGPREDR